MNERGYAGVGNVMLLRHLELELYMRVYAHFVGFVCSKQKHESSKEVVSERNEHLQGLLTQGDFL